MPVTSRSSAILTAIVLAWIGIAALFFSMGGPSDFPSMAQFVGIGFLLLAAARVGVVRERERGFLHVGWWTRGGGCVVALAVGVLVYETLAPGSGEAVMFGIELLALGLVILLIVGPGPLRWAAGYWIVAIGLSFFALMTTTAGAYGPRTSPSVAEILLAMSAVFALLGVMQTVRAVLQLRQRANRLASSGPATT